jgi:hypothetical protein
MEQEIASLHANHTWTLLDLPPGHKAIPVKWVYKLKSGLVGTPPKYKARLVVRGDRQHEGLDYQETFAPVVKWSTMRLVVSMAAQRGWPIHHLDVKCAYLNGPITDAVFLQQPPGFVSPGREHLVCCVHRAIYALRQSARAWNETIDAFLISLGLTPCCADPSLYVRLDGDLLILLIIYVDDLMITGNHFLQIDSLCAKLCARFDMSLLGPLSLYLAVDFFYNTIGILFSHRRYIINCLTNMGLSDCHPVPIPLDPRTCLALDMDSPLLSAHLITYYHCGVGKLLHVTNTRPDVGFSVGVVTRFTTRPQEAHLEAMINIFRYLKGTLDSAMHYQRGGEVVPTGYTDSDYLGDLTERKSTSAFVFTIGSAPISWKSQLQDEVAQSSSEAEYRSLAAGALEAMWIRNIFSEIGLPLSRPITMYVDNQSSIKMAENPVLHKRTKHIEKGCHLVRDHIKKGRVALEFIRSHEQVADILTKPLPKVSFHELKARLGLKTFTNFQSQCID